MANSSRGDERQLCHVSRRCLGMEFEKIPYRWRNFTVLSWRNMSAGKLYLLNIPFPKFYYIVFLQEVDHFNFLKRILDTQGFSGMFFPKPDSPCFYIDGNNGPDGCAVFYRRSKFELQEARNKILDIWKVQSNQVSTCAVYVLGIFTCCQTL